MPVAEREPVSATARPPSPPPPAVPGTPGSGFADLLVVNPSRVDRATGNDIARAETELDAPLPRGYGRFVRRVGGGSLGHFVGVLTPAQVASETDAWRDRIRNYWFWDTTEAGVDRTALQDRGILLASSFDGDELCFDPADPEAFYVLPRNEDVAHRVGPDFLDALQWMLAGNLNPWVEGWTFEVNARRLDEHGEFAPGTTLDEATAALVALGEYSHVVDLDGRTTFFLPDIAGRLSVYESGSEPGTWFDLSYDDEADPARVRRILETMSND